MVAKTWEEVETFDDIVLPGERDIINELESTLKGRCPSLKKEDNYFYYCGLKLPEIEDKKEDKKPSPISPIYQRKVDVGELSLYCMKNFEDCCFYCGKLER